MEWQSHEKHIGKEVCELFILKPEIFGESVQYSTGGVRMEELERCCQYPSDHVPMKSGGARDKQDEDQGAADQVRDQADSSEDHQTPHPVHVFLLFGI